MKYPRVFIVLCALGALVILGSGIAVPMIPLFAIELGASTIEIGFIRSSYFAARIFLELPIGMLSDRIGRRKLIIFGLLLSAISAVICGTSPNTFQLIAGRVLWGIGGAMYFSSSTVFILDLFPDDRGKALGVFHGIEFAGRLVGSPLGGTLSEYLGFRAAFFSTGVALLSGFLFAFFSKDFRNPERIASSRGKTQGFIVSLALLSSRQIAVISLLGFLRTFNMQGITQTMVPLFQAEELGFGPFLIGIIGMFRTVGVVVISLSLGYLTEKIGIKTILVGGIVASAISNICQIVFPTFLGQAVVGLIAGFGGGMMVVVLPILISEAVDSSVRGLAMGAYRTVMNIGSFIGPIAATTVGTVFGSINVSFYLLTAILILGMPLTLTINRKSSQKEAKSS